MKNLSAITLAAALTLAGLAAANSVSAQESEGFTNQNAETEFSDAATADGWLDSEIQDAVAASDKTEVNV